jgi:small subunit ribosomal protein S17e
MGRIKTKQIKRLTRMFMKDSDKFTTDFNQNKLVADEIAVKTPKKMRNVIAGYATRLVKEEIAKAV